MSIVLKDIDLNISEEVNDENLEPVSDEELAEIIEEISRELVSEIEAEYESVEISPEMEEILATEDMNERLRLYHKYHHIIFPEN